MMIPTYIEKFTHLPIRLNKFLQENTSHKIPGALYNLDILKFSFLLISNIIKKSSGTI